MSEDRTTLPSQIFEAEMSSLAGRIAELCPVPFVIWLKGPLGAGKTTLVRAFLKALGFAGRVKSPTYTLLEYYELPGKRVVHADLYRLQSPEEADFLGWENTLDAIVWIEWPEKGEDRLPKPDLIVNLAYAGSGRQIRWDAQTAAGSFFLQQLME